jgi:alanine racemase
MIFFSNLSAICQGKVVSLFQDSELKALLVDSRKLGAVHGTIFFAISGERNDGHDYLDELYQKGMRLFVVERPIDYGHYPEANFLSVTSSISALQALVGFHRQQFLFPVIGITGSNGKTIIKEWLSGLLSKDFNLVKSPGSYNSQLGVPLSVWQMADHHTLGIFEAGISTTDEMDRLQAIIKPTIGIFSNIGTAHAEGFKSQEQKIYEKLKLFKGSRQIIYCKDHPLLSRCIENSFDDPKLISWGTTKTAKIFWSQTSESTYKISWNTIHFQLHLPFKDRASVENVGHCVAAMLALKCHPVYIQQQISLLKTVPMRLELKQGINNCELVDDSYNNDLAGLQIGLNFLLGSPKKKRAVILSDIFQSGLDDRNMVLEITHQLKDAEVDSLVGIGATLFSHAEIVKAEIDQAEFFLTTEQYLDSGRWNTFRDEAILLKGARNFQFEKIAQRLENKIHGTVLELDLGAMVSNLNFFKSCLKPKVKLMVMVKAFAYGSGAVQVASLLQYHKADYLGVAYADEGVELRKNGITLPIMVMNPSIESYQTLLDYELEPEVYSLRIAKSLALFLGGKQIKIHLKLDTGMHRLGLIESDVDEIISILQENKNIKVASIFSHLAGADEQKHDDFTKNQVDAFIRITNKIRKELGIDPLLHILNSSGLLRFADYQFNMVRLGIGLYGINPTNQNANLKPVATLKTIISQVKTVNRGETVGYGRAGKADDYPVTMATIAIGYADGFSRAFSKGRGKVLINGKLAPVIGNVCMDMTMVDISDVTAKENDEVIIFGRGNPIEQVADSINTIPYEILTNTSERVKRVFFAESL